MSRRLHYKRALLKLSGEALSGKAGSGFDINALKYIVGEIKEAHTLGCQIAVVIGGGNFIRGSHLSKIGIDLVTAHYMGMLGTVINGMGLQNILEQNKLHTRVLSSLDIMHVAEPFIRRRAIRHLEKGRIVIFAGGTGSPYFTTDTAAALRASEISADVLLKGTKVDGVYGEDPEKNAKAKLFKKINPLDVVKQGLRFMDLTAVTLSMENKIPIVVFNIFKKGNLKKVLLGEKVGSEIGGK